MRARTLLIALICAVMAPFSALAGSFMDVYGETTPPAGFGPFCEWYPQECVASPTPDTRLKATPEILAALDQINLAVNKTIEPITDLEYYGVKELWTLPVQKGDCEDYALIKRHLLIAAGFPAGALLMTVVRDEKGEGHAVLTVRLNWGDFILDNKTDEFKRWNDVPYHFVSRQSYVNPYVWYSLEEPITTSAR
jgi:predicted transglutaminase-like cysteine proteinase